MFCVCTSNNAGHFLGQTLKFWFFFIWSVAGRYINIEGGDGMRRRRAIIRWCTDDESV